MDGAARRAHRWARRALWIVDRVSDTLASLALSALVVVVSWQVFSRYVLNSSPRWSTEVAVILLVWLGLLATAIGARERSHVAMAFVADRLPRITAPVVNRLGSAFLLAFGLYLVIQGWEFTQLTMRSTLPSTGLPTAVQYAAMPVSGVLLTVYGALQLLGIETKRDVDAGDELAETIERSREAGD